MKYLPTIVLDRGVEAALIAGQLQLQRGQWVRIGGGVSRFVRRCRGYLDIVHPSGAFGSGVVRSVVFGKRCQVARNLEGKCNG